MQRRPKWMGRALICLASVSLFVLATQWLKNRLGITSLNLLAAEIDTLEKETESPDGRYTAKLLYRENLGMTCGYYHVSIKSNKLDESDPDVIEVAAEGLSDIAWNDNESLAVTYDATKNKDHLEDTMFVKKPTTWGPIRIEYVPKLNR